MNVLSILYLKMMQNELIIMFAPLVCMIKGHKTDTSEAVVDRWIKATCLRCGILREIRLKRKE